MSFTDGIDAYCSAFEAYMNKDTIQDLRKEIDEMTCLVNGFRSENDRLKEENAKLYLSNEELKRENERRSYTILSAENKCLKEINSNLNVEIERLKDQCHKLGKDYDALTKETAFFEEKIKDLERINGILTRRIFMDKYDYAVTKARELKNERLKFEEEIKKLKEENKDLDKRLKDVEADWMAAECEKIQLEKAFDEVSKQKIDLINALTNKAETKIYQLSAEDFAKTFKGQWTISIAPDEVSTTDFTVNNENDKDRLSYYLTYKDNMYNEPFDKIYSYLRNYQIERVVISKLLDEIRRKYTDLEFDNIWLKSKAQKIEKELEDCTDSNTSSTLGERQSEADAQREQMWNDYMK